MSFYYPANNFEISKGSWWELSNQWSDLERVRWTWNLNLNRTRPNFIFRDTETCSPQLENWPWKKLESFELPNVRCTHETWTCMSIFRSKPIDIGEIENDYRTMQNASFLEACTARRGGILFSILKFANPNLWPTLPSDFELEKELHPDCEIKLLFAI